MRPPYGSYNQLVLDAAGIRGQSVIIWDFEFVVELILPRSFLILTRSIVLEILLAPVHKLLNSFMIAKSSNMSTISSLWTMRLMVSYSFNQPLTHELNNFLSSYHSVSDQELTESLTIESIFIATKSSVTPLTTSKQLDIGSQLSPNVWTSLLTSLSVHHLRLM